jgi:hypothetical protein
VTDALLRWLVDAHLEFGVELGVVDPLQLPQHERVSASLDGGKDVLEARLLAAYLPSRDLGTVAAKKLRELRLGDSPETGVAPSAFEKTILIPIAELERWLEKNAARYGF